MKEYEVFDSGDNEEDSPHEVSELICLRCLHRWIGVYPQQLKLADMECKCGAIGYIIKTGQTITESEDQ
mgnify:CR=1 FL=1